MMRKVFKHKTLWWIAENVNIDEPYNYQATNMHIIVIPKLSIEYLTRSSDREEVIEKDWYDQIIEEMKIRNHIITSRSFKIDLKELIEKHAQKQVKFTRDELDYLKLITTPGGTYVSYNLVIDFLKKHNLLSFDE